MRLQNQMRLRDQFQTVLPSATRATADQMLADIRELAPDIAARIAEMETERRMPLDLVETLRSIGVFRIFAPRSHGGLEFDFPTGLEIIGARPDRRVGRLDSDDRLRVGHLPALAAAERPMTRSIATGRM
jgi:alkylation response protein AidB-like acyl-CoA dehydrogenase